MLITAFQFEDHREPRKEVRSLYLAERLVGFELGTFLFRSQRLNPLGHSHLKYALFLSNVVFQLNFSVAQRFHELSFKYCLKMLLNTNKYHHSETLFISTILASFYKQHQAEIGKKSSKC